MSTNESDKTSDKDCKIIVNDQETLELKETKKYLGCYSSRKSCQKWTIIIGLISAFVIGLLIFLIWPRPPIFKLLPIPSEGQQIKFNQEGDVVNNLQAASMDNPFGVWATFKAPISVFSENYINFEMKTGELELSVNSPTGPLTQFVLNGVLPTSIIYGRSNNTITANVTVTLNIQQGVTPDNVNKELQYMASICTGTDKYLEVNYKLSAEIPSLSWLGIRPSGRGILTLQCPEIIVEFGKNTTKAITA